LSDRIRDAYDGISQAVLDSEALVDLLLRVFAPTSRR